MHGGVRYKVPGGSWWVGHNTELKPGSQGTTYKTHWHPLQLVHEEELERRIIVIGKIWNFKGEHFCLPLCFFLRVPGWLYCTVTCCIQFVIQTAFSQNMSKTRDRNYILPGDFHQETWKVQNFLHTVHWWWQGCSFTSVWVETVTCHGILGQIELVRVGMDQLE
jgi:hypothetical protein